MQLRRAGLLLAAGLLVGCLSPDRMSRVDYPEGAGEIRQVFALGPDDAWLEALSGDLFHFDGADYARVARADLDGERVLEGPLVFAALRPGVLAGADARGVFLVERGGAVTHLDPIGLSGGHRYTLAARDEVLFAIQNVVEGATALEPASLHRLDGESWTELRAPPGTADHLEVTDDGQLFANLQDAFTGLTTAAHFDGDQRWTQLPQHALVRGRFAPTGGGRASLLLSPLTVIDEDGSLEVLDWDGAAYQRRFVKIPSTGNPLVTVVVEGVARRPGGDLVLLGTRRRAGDEPRDELIIYELGLEEATGPRRLARFEDPEPLLSAPLSSSSGALSYLSQEGLWLGQLQD